ncbi:MAG: ribosome-associated translation inhibitor RaiA [Acidobacteria bacterium]|nr:ribosome-associated translation inhibitor RaiA [Acidobacteriota bacterium]
MKIDFTGRGVDITRDVKEHTEQKLDRLTKHLGDIQDISVVLSTEKYRHKAEIKFLSNKHTFHGHEETADMLASIDRVVEKLEKQARRFKQKKIKTKRKTGESIRINVISDDSSESDLKVIRTDHVVVKPMSLEEAVEELKKHENDFFLFQNAEHDGVSVVYRRRDGHFGYIEPVF